jgi:predicted deacetylase
MNARYIFRMDDITPTMDWGRFESLMNLFMKHSIKPLLGIVPDNRDPNLCRQRANPRFWDEMRGLQESGAIDIAQHGYQHTLVARPGAALLASHCGTHEVSEFAGESYHDQVFKIAEGNRILLSHGITTTYWMAPNHSFDKTTLRALVDVGFTAVSDGVSLFPFRSCGLVFVPQQVWRPRWMPCGVQTICLHSNTITPSEIKELRLFIRRPYAFPGFSEVLDNAPHGMITRSADLTFSLVYHFANQIKRRTRKPSREASHNLVLEKPLDSKQPLPLHLGS